MKLTEFYVVAANFGDLGLGNAGDVTASRDEAFDQFAESVAAHQPTRAFHLTFDFETGVFEVATEVTSDFQDELREAEEEQARAVAEQAAHAAHVAHETASWRFV